MTPVSINILSESTVSKIAAGEVIERPANVVKELVENALDAGARRISILLEDGGKELVRVIDDGRGMTRAEAQLAWLPHATSKIRDDEDLFRIRSYGFRGEALSSMAAVAELTLETRHAEEQVGTCLAVSGGGQQSLRDLSRGPGTTVSVKNLFLHSPVRRKFLGTGKSETLRILNMATRTAFAHPGVGFRVAEKGRDLLRFTEGSLRHRAGEVLGFNITNELVPIDWTDGRIHILGFISTLQQARSKPSHQYLYVNARPVQSGLVGRAWAQGYDVLPPGRFPMGVLFLTIPPEDVDVNVHPAKKEVRFLKENQIHWALSQAVRQGLRKVAEAPALALQDDATAAPAPAGEAAPVFSFRSREAGGGGDPKEKGTGFPLILFPPSPGNPKGSRDDSGEKLAVRSREDPSPAAPWQVRDKEAGGFPRGEWGSRGGDFAGISSVPFLQIHNSFILFAVQSGLMLVNQQAAHERILYEKSLDALRKPGHFSSQQLLFPEVLEFTPEESRLLEENLHHFHALAFDLESFGGSTFQLRGLPMEISQARARQVIHDMVHDLLASARRGGKAGMDGDGFAGRLALAYARVAGVRLGEPMDYPQVAALIDNLFATRNPYVAPSGATIVLRYTLEEILRRFGIKDLRG